jgi:hypothetical protein
MAYPYLAIITLTRRGQEKNHGLGHAEKEKPIVRGSRRDKRAEMSLGPRTKH